MKGYKKGQAAIEFLMTWGWAVLVVLIAIGALAYFGVLSPDKFTNKPVQQSVITEVAVKYCNQYEDMDLESYTVFNDTVHITCFRLEKGSCVQLGNGTEECTLDIKNVTLTKVYLLSLK